MSCLPSSRWCLMQRLPQQRFHQSYRHRYFTGQRAAMSTVLVAPRAIFRILLTLALGGGLTGCHDLTGSQALPSGTPNPSFYNNATGALGMRNAAVFAFANVLPPYIVSTGLLTDELEDLSVLSSQGVRLQNAGAITDPVDERILPELPYGSQSGYLTDKDYQNLQGARTAILQALGQLATYDSSAQDTAILKPAAGRALRGELYALEGFDEIMLADLFCSGIPLSTLNFQHDFTYRAGSTTAQVYQDALTKFDTALALSGDSIQIVNLARVGQGRAELDLGRYAAAADDVASVPTGFQYQLAQVWSSSTGAPIFFSQVSQVTVSDREGGNGLPFLTSGDPRSTDTAVTITFPTTYTIGFPRKYVAGLSGALTAPVTVTDGIEARLIQAEAALHAGNVTTWLTMVNQLRTNGVNFTPTPDTVVDTLGVTGCTADTPCGPTGFPPFFDPSIGYRLVSSSIDTTVFFNADGSVALITPAYQTCNSFSAYQPDPNGCYPTLPVQVYVAQPVWQAGTGGVNGLAPLTDPGPSSSNPDSARVALLFQERAYWLYLTGHRQGDLRRLLRQYGRYWPDESHAYPTGSYPGLGAGTYGTNVNAPIPGSEYINPLFHGCVTRAP